MNRILDEESLYNTLEIVIGYKEVGVSLFFYEGTSPPHMLQILTYNGEPLRENCETGKIEKRKAKILYIKKNVCLVSQLVHD